MEESCPDFDSDNPYRVLGVPFDSSRAEVKQAYRRLLKIHRPERDPLGFQRIREAYEAILQAGESSMQHLELSASSRPGTAHEPLEARALEVDREADRLIERIELCWKSEGRPGLLEAVEAARSGPVAPDELARHLLQLARQELSRDPQGLAGSLVEIASELDGLSDWVYHEAEGLRLTREALLESRRARTDLRLGDELIDFVLGAPDLGDDELNAAHQRLLERWSRSNRNPHRSLSRMTRHYPALAGMVPPILDRLEQRNRHSWDSTKRGADARPAVRAFASRLEVDLERLARISTPGWGWVVYFVIAMASTITLRDFPVLGFFGVLVAIAVPILFTRRNEKKIQRRLREEVLRFLESEKIPLQVVLRELQRSRRRSLKDVRLHRLLAGDFELRFRAASAPSTRP